MLGPIGFATAAMALTRPARSPSWRRPVLAAGRIEHNAASRMSNPAAKPVSMLAQISTERWEAPDRGGTALDASGSSTKSTIATPSTVISSLVTPATLVSTTPLITIASASQGPVTRAVLGTDSAASTTAAVVTSPMTSEARPAPPAPTRPASVTW